MPLFKTLQRHSTSVFITLSNGSQHSLGGFVVVLTYFPQAVISLMQLLLAWLLTLSPFIATINTTIPITTLIFILLSILLLLLLHWVFFLKNWVFFLEEQELGFLLEELGFLFRNRVSGHYKKRKSLMIVGNHGDFERGLNSVKDCLFKNPRMLPNLTRWRVKGAP